MKSQRKNKKKSLKFLLRIGFVVFAIFINWQNVLSQNHPQSNSFSNHFSDSQNYSYKSKAIFVEDLWSYTHISFHDTINERDIKTYKEDGIDYKDIVDEKITAIGTFEEDTTDHPYDNSRKLRWPTIAFKTNLLFDAASALNIEIEASITNRWSIAGEYIFPWWLNENKQVAIQNLTGTIEGRFWLSKGIEKNKLTGFFLGLYGGAGYYDIELKREKGYQGEFFHTGISVGYVKPFIKNNKWRVEYSIGMGYLDTDFREYVAKYGVDNEWHLIRLRNGNTKYFGPTRAKVSIIWLLNNK